METLQRTANRGSISTGYDIANSLKLEADNGEVVTQTIGAGSRTTATYSFWFKRTELGADMQIAGISPIASETTRFLITSNDTLDVESGVAGDNSSLVTNRVFRDTSAWYHFVVAIDTTQATEANRVKVYVNGVQETSFSASEYPAQNTNLTIGVSGYTWSWGAYSSTLIKSSGYLAEAYYIDAQQLDPTSFGEFDEDTGIWKPIAYTGSFGSNGHYLDFSDAGNLGNNSSGVGTDFTLTNITSADQATDTPTNNFCTWNPLWAYQFQPTIKEGATVAAYGDSTDENAKATIGLTNGKWYWEAKPSGTIGSQFIGISTDGDSNISSGQGLTQNYQMTIEPQGRYYSYAGSLSESAAGQFTALTTSDTLGIALDMDSATQTIKYYANGSLILTRDLIAEMQGRTVFPFLQNYESRTFNINFGGYTINTISSAATDENGYGTFEHAPPSGYYAICTKNLAEYG